MGMRQSFQASASSSSICLLALCLLPIPAASKSSETLHNHVRTAVTSGQAARIGTMSHGQRMTLAIILPLRNQSELASLLKRLYDPSSPDYHHFLTVSQFTAQFGPSRQDYEFVEKFARSKGLDLEACFKKIHETEHADRVDKTSGDEGRRVLDRGLMNTEQNIFSDKLLHSEHLRGASEHLEKQGRIAAG